MSNNIQPSSTVTPAELLEIIILLTHTEPRRYPFEVRRTGILPEESRRIAGIQSHLEDMLTHTERRARSTILEIYSMYVESPCMPAQETAQLIYALMQQKEA